MFPRCCFFLPNRVHFLGATSANQSHVFDDLQTFNCHRHKDQTEQNPGPSGSTDQPGETGNKAVTGETGNMSEIANKGVADQTGTTVKAQEDNDADYLWLRSQYCFFVVLIILASLIIFL